MKQLLFVVLGVVSAGSPTFEAVAVEVMTPPVVTATITVWTVEQELNNRLQRLRVSYSAIQNPSEAATHTLTETQERLHRIYERLSKTVFEYSAVVAMENWVVAASETFYQALIAGDSQAHSIVALELREALEACLNGIEDGSVRQVLAVMAGSGGRLTQGQAIVVPLSPAESLEAFRLTAEFASAQITNDSFRTIETVDIQMARPLTLLMKHYLLTRMVLVLAEEPASVLQSLEVTRSEAADAIVRGYSEVKLEMQERDIVDEYAAAVDRAQTAAEMLALHEQVTRRVQSAYSREAVELILTEALSNV